MRGSRGSRARGDLVAREAGSAGAPSRMLETRPSARERLEMLARRRRRDARGLCEGADRPRAPVEERVEHRGAGRRCEQAAERCDVLVSCHDHDCNGATRRSRPRCTLRAAARCVLRRPRASRPSTHRPGLDPDAGRHTARRAGCGCPTTRSPIPSPRSSSTSPTARTTRRRRATRRCTPTSPRAASRARASTCAARATRRDRSRASTCSRSSTTASTVIAWLASRPWCNGRVGMIGKSWGGFNGLQIAAMRPPALGCVVSVCSTDDRYADDVHYAGGVRASRQPRSRGRRRCSRTRRDRPTRQCSGRPGASAGSSGSTRAARSRTSGWRTSGATRSGGTAPSATIPARSSATSRWSAVSPTPTAARSSACSRPPRTASAACSARGPTSTRTSGRRGPRSGSCSAA